MDDSIESFRFVFANGVCTISMKLDRQGILFYYYYFCYCSFFNLLEK